MYRDVHSMSGEIRTKEFTLTVGGPYTAGYMTPQLRGQALRLIERTEIGHVWACEW